MGKTLCACIDRGGSELYARSASLGLPARTLERAVAAIVDVDQRCTITGIQQQRGALGKSPRWECHDCGAPAKEVIQLRHAESEASLKSLGPDGENIFFPVCPACLRALHTAEGMRYAGDALISLVRDYVHAIRCGRGQS